MSAHTPGPWSIGHNPSIVIDPRENYVARCDQSSVIEDEAEIAANARLIAAAPEMYKALKRAVRRFARLPADMDGPSSVMTQMRAAIAKAEGRS